MKYIDAEKLEERVTELIASTRQKDWPIAEYYLKRVIDIIDSLQQKQPEVDFKVKERKWVHDAVDNVFPEDGDFMSEFDFRKILKDTARHFYKLGLNARKV